MEMRADRLLLDNGLCGVEMGNSQIRVALPLHRQSLEQGRSSPTQASQRTPAPGRRLGYRQGTPQRRTRVWGYNFHLKDKHGFSPSGPSPAHARAHTHTHKEQHIFYPRDNAAASIFRRSSSPGSPIGKPKKLELKYITSFLGARVSRVIK